MSSADPTSPTSPENKTKEMSTMVPQPTVAVLPPAPEEVGNEEHQEQDALLTTPSRENEGLDGGSTPATVGEDTSHVRVATLSSPWQYDALADHCTRCHSEFHPLFNRRHHCRLCGNIFCHACTSQRALIPPSRIVLVPSGGKKVQPPGLQDQPTVSFSPDPDPDRMLTYYENEEPADQQQQQQQPESSLSSSQTLPHQKLLYGKGLEERVLLARQPLRVCQACCAQLQPLQNELACHNSNAMRFNHIDPGSLQRWYNSPLAFTLGHEIRKAAYTLHNLLPLPKRRRPGALVWADDNAGGGGGDELFDVTGATMQQQQQNLALTTRRDLQQCQENCLTVSPNLANLDGVKIPARLLERAKGVAVMTVCKGGFGLAGVEFGTGLVVARLSSGDDHDTAMGGSSSGVSGSRWSAPSAIGTGGLAWGALVGAQVSDHVFLLMTNAAVEMLFSGSVQLGADVGVAVGPVGRSVEADLGAAPGKVAPIYTYSVSKGLYAGISLAGKVIGTRDWVNEKFYGRKVSGPEILAGAVPTPPAAQPLYEALTRCHVYATHHNFHHSAAASTATSMTPAMAAMEAEYGTPTALHHRNTSSRVPADQQSYSGMSDITPDPGY